MKKRHIDWNLARVLVGMGFASFTIAALLTWEMEIVWWSWLIGFVVYCLTVFPAIYHNSEVKE